MDFYLGIDIGTSRVKAVLFDQHFQACASAAQNTGPRLSANGEAEQDMAQLWQSVVAILRDIARHPALQNGRLRAIGLAGQGEGVWLCDAEGEPVGPGILWSDTRSRELMNELLSRPGFDRRFFDDTGTHLQPCNTSMQLCWLKHHQPERLAAARYLFFAKDWIRFRLTGVAALDLTDASTSLLNQQSGKLSAVVLNEMGLADLQPLFPPLLAPDAQAGALREEVAALTGLPAATPVAAGALDVCSAALGCGAVLMKGGHLDDTESPDWLFTREGEQRFTAPRVQTKNTHGTGCTLSAALAALRPRHVDWAATVIEAKAWLSAALAQADSLEVGHGIGPVHHFHAWW